MYAILNTLQKSFNKKNEARVLQMLRGPRMPPWVKRAYLADQQLHQMGVDIVVETDKKKVLLQVKPNYFLANLMGKWAQFSLAVIVCNASVPDDLLEMRLVEGLEYGYNRT